MVKSTVSERCTAFYRFLSRFFFCSLPLQHCIITQRGTIISVLAVFWFPHRYVRKTSACIHTHMRTYAHKDWPLAHYPFHTFDPWIISQLSSDGIFFSFFLAAMKAKLKVVDVLSLHRHHGVYYTVYRPTMNAQERVNFWFLSVCMFSFVIFTLLIIINRYFSFYINVRAHTHTHEM